ncbi:MAG: Xylulose kinase [bacterium ADurb.Bin429]|nr:MAG: Xylulose kinase [bacterium ADurb.Bin429]
MSLLGIDVGTSQCKAAAFAVDGRCLAAASRAYPTLRPEFGYAELSSARVWRDVRDVMAEVARRTTNDPITALCVGSCGEAMVPLTRDRRILGNAILSSDIRGVEYSDMLRESFGQEAFYRLNPNVIGPHYSLPKLCWMRDHDPDLYARADYFLSWADAVTFLLGCEPVTNTSLANRTLLFDLDAGDWSEALLAWSGIERARLGRVVPGGTVVGTIADSTADALGLPRGVMVVAGGHDQCCNALGCGAIAAGMAVCGMGSYECITPIFPKPTNPLAMLAAGLNIEDHVLPGLYVAFLYNQAGILVKWFRETFAAEATDDEDDLYFRLNTEMPGSPTELLVLPHFDPPQWPRFIGDTAGVILGLHTSTTRGEILKAIMECATLYFVEGVDALHAMGMPLTSCVAAGGGARSDAWVQIKADIFGIPFMRPRVAEGGLMGAAMLAGLATGVFASPTEATETCVQADRVFEPDPHRHMRYREKAARYQAMYPTLAELLMNRG